MRPILAGLFALACAPVAPFADLSALTGQSDVAQRIDAARAAYKARRFQDAHREIALALAQVRADHARQATALAGAAVPAVLRAGIDVPQPERTRNVPFRFPVNALRDGITGFVAVEAVIDERGRVKAAKVVRSVRHLDEAALSAVRQWQFAPTQKDGKPVEVVALFLTNFTARTSPQLLDDLEFAAFYFGQGQYLQAEGALLRALGVAARDITACGTAFPVGSDKSLIQAPVKIKDVRPEYPPMMMDLRRQAEAVIDQQGAVTCLHVKEGDPFFEQSAVDAVQQWLFTPTLLDGKPVEVLMTVTVKYGVT